MKPVFAISLFLLALPMVAAEAPCQKIEERTNFFLGKYKLNENRVSRNLVGISI